ncbi:protocadherin gamma-B5-like isoform X20 [Bufo gargarizans]|uniref:protocadherin gamma-B5-like isoform X20 n=1 Tax=Bufo gargarizans TaxID=30331 RepID=UPI001CF11A82|nr:protocadherin gamma-B5-like isoform X20 [Bufo gargarizans]
MDEKNTNGGKGTMKWQVSFFVFSFMSDLICAQLHYSIPEEMKQGSTVGNIAKDLDLTTNELSFRKFHIVSRGKLQYFNVNLESGNLYVAERIDRERICDLKPNCFISFEAVIENPLHLYTIRVEIQDVNDNPPGFSKNTFDVVISESALPGVRLALGHAHDLDIGTNSVQDYNINQNEYFSLGIKMTKEGIKFPELILEKHIDREKQSIHELILTALDGGQPPNTGTAVIKINVHDVNDNFPKFSKDTFELSLNENVPVGFLVLQLNAVDKDEGLNSQITYSFRDIPEFVYSLFSIDTENGTITVIGDIDYELRERYVLTVEAKDGGGLETHCKILISIIDLNDNAPEVTITSLQDAIPENCPPDTFIALINVHDLDSEKNGEVVCEINDDVPFKLISSSTNYYKLLTTTYIDRETKPYFNITIKAIDNGSPQLSSNKSVQLTILDVNDNSPIFEKTTYIVDVQENNNYGMSIHCIHASDDDMNENATITYSVINNNIEKIPVTSYVSINSMTGVLYAQRSFDYEQLREFQFQVMAKDSGSPPRSSNVTVKICIIDKNDNAPKILYPSPDTEGSALFEFIPHSAEKGYLVTKVIAVDADSGHNAWLSYHLLQVPDLSIFTIGQYTGEIRIGRDLPDLESLRQKLVVLVKDNGVPSLSSTVTLSLVVAENFQQIVPEIKHKQSHPDSSSPLTFYLLVCIALISIFFIVTIIAITFYKCRQSRTTTSFGALSRNVYPQFTLGCPSEISDTSLPFPFSYDVCVTLDSKQNEIAYLKPVQNVPTDNLIDTDDSAKENNCPKDMFLPTCNPTKQAQPGAEWRFSQAQRPGPSGAQPAEEAGVWPNNQFETERLQAMILASANEAAEGTSGLGGGTGTMGLSARYGPQFTLQHVPDYRQNVYIPGSTLTPTNAGGKRDGKGGGNKKKSGKKEKK